MLLMLWIVLGLLTGFIVSKVMSKLKYAWPHDMLLGVLGAVLGGQLSIMSQPERTTNPGIGSLLVAIAGAIIAVVAYRLITRQKYA